MTKVQNKSTNLIKGITNRTFISNITICTWNIGGLISANLNKLTDSNFLNNITAYDIVLLTETHIGKDVNIVLPGYKYFPVCRPKSANNRYFGGLGIFVKNTILPGIEILKNTSLDYQWVKLDKKFFNFAKNIFLCLAYIIPASSSYIFQSDDDPLETKEKDIIIHYDEGGHIVLCGDLNARTGSEFDFIENDTYDPFEMDDEEYEYDIWLQKRKSCKFKWTDCSKEQFQDALCHPSCKLDINAFLTNNYQDKSNINSSATDLQNIIIKAAQMSLKFKSNKYKKKTINKKKWYDQDLYNKNRELNTKAKHLSENPYNINIRNNYF
ncbi:unnamed protein product [Mytilus coruscus]|uniref:Endonuclease/exonuclease/phosphatase domain-containing protein n=1 Tax=Mytilus coruscus TaxID=42192 RepID=A0A6J7ZW35_MYTCO|nr:unnamed protein product [Mytilus coruscus]